MFYSKMLKTRSEVLFSSSSFTIALVRQTPVSFSNLGLGSTKATVYLGKVLCCKKQDKTSEIWSESD